MPQTERYIDLPFCYKGVHRGGAYASQPDLTTPLSKNAIPDDVREERMRGSRRPALVKAYPTRVSGAAAKVRLLSSVRGVSTSGIASFEDDFPHIGGPEAISSPWTAASWFLTGLAPVLIEPTYAGVLGPPFGSHGAAVLDAIDDLDTSNLYTITIRADPASAALYGGTFLIFLRMDDTTPNGQLDGAIAGFVLDDQNEFVLGSLEVYVAGVPTSYLFSETVAMDPIRPLDLSVIVDGNDITVQADGTTILSQTISAAAGDRVGFGLIYTSQISLIDFFRVQYLTGDTIAEANRNFLVSSAGGQLKRENAAGTDLEAISIAPVAISSDKLLEAVEFGGQLYIADYGPLKISGDDGVISGADLTSMGAGDWSTYGIDTDNDVVVLTGPNVFGTFQIDSIMTTTLTLADTPATSGGTSFRIEKAPLIYNPITNTLSLWVVDPPDPANQVPVGNPHIGVFLDRIGLSGAMSSPQVYFFARRGSEFRNDLQDWDFSQTDEGAAFAGDESNAGRIGEPVTAMFSSVDDYLIFGSLGTLWIMRGDPTIGGRIDRLSSQIGVVGGKAWTAAPDGTVYFLSRDGIYMVGPGAQGVPREVSEPPIPIDLANINTDLITVSLQYDVQRRGIHIYLAPEVAGTGDHWFFHLDTRGFFFWDFSDQNLVPFATLYYEADKTTSAALIAGGRDGFLRRYDPAGNTDDSNEIDSFVLYGPLHVASHPRLYGVLHELTVALDSDSGLVNWELYSGETAEESVDKALDSNVLPLKSGTTRANTNGTSRLSHWKPRQRAKYIIMKIANGDITPWILDYINAGLWDVGKQKVR